MLSLKQINDVCLVGKGASQCRFAGEDDTGGFYCIKQTFKRKDIDSQVKEFIKKNKASGIDPYTLQMPIGDNCGGYTFFRHKMQGYDIV